MAYWTVPRNEMDAMDQEVTKVNKAFENCMAEGMLVSSGSDRFLLHMPDGYTNDNHWIGPSMASVLKVREQAKKVASPSTLLANATKYADAMFMTKSYNWHAGSIKDGYPGAFTVMYTAAKPEGLDKFSDAVNAMQVDSTRMEALNAVMDWSAHRDFVLRSNRTAK